MNLHIPALIPDDYLPDVNSRLTLYKRIASAEDDTQLKELQVEMIDRFGLLPDAAKNLIAVAELKLKARRVGIHKVEMTATGGTLEFNEDTPVDPGFIIQLVQTRNKMFKFEGSQKLRIVKKTETARERLAMVDGLIEEFAREISQA